MEKCYGDFSDAEKQILWLKCKNGDGKAREKLIGGNYPLVGAVAGKLSFNNDEYDELFQSGVLGLIKAVDGFDQNLGVAFSTYALSFIHGEIMRQKERIRGVKRQRNTEVLFSKIKAAEKELREGSGYEPSFGEVAAKIGESTENIIWIMENYKENIALDEICITDENAINNYEIVENRLFIKAILKEVTAKERIILLEHYINGKTQKVIAQELGLSQTQISRLEKAALKKLKKITQM